MQTDIGQSHQPEAARLAIITASDAEAAHICRGLHLADKRIDQPGMLWYGRYRSQEVVLLRCGMGPERATAGLRWLYGCCRLWGVLSVGFAGGLQPKLATGDAVWVTHIGTAGSPSIRTVSDLVPDSTLTAIVAEGARRAGLVQHRGLLLSSSELIPRATAKLELGEQCGALAVDMESHSLRREAGRFHLPFASMRTIFDTCHDDLAVPVDVCTTPDGRLRYGRLAAHIAQHPRMLLDLPRLGSKARLAGRHLHTWLDHFFTILDRQSARLQPCTTAPIPRLRDVEIEVEVDKP
jgi:adenosylhomocysteine nucleosidase